MQKLKALSSLLCLLCLSGCYHWSRLQETGATPPMTPTQDPRAHKNYAPVRMPMPDAKNPRYSPNSLWRTGAKSFFKDQRASKEGDLVTIVIDMKDKVHFKNETRNERTSSSSATLTKFFGLEKLLPQSAGTAAGNLITAGSAPSSDGESEIKRKDIVKTNIAATVTQVLPNGNLVIQGRQEMRINFDIREVLITGVIRSSDITPENTIDFEKIAEARLGYGGRGEGSDVQKTPYAQQVLTQLLPF